MTFEADEVIQPAPQLWKPRTHPIRFVEIHSTRGCSKNEYAATKGWMQSRNNDQGGWGGSCSFIIGEDGRICRVLTDEQQPTYGAGFGGRGSTYAIDEYGIAVEWCQSEIDTDFSEAQYEAGARLYAHYAKQNNIPPVMLNIPRQTGEPPSGFLRHDRCENGVKLGKSDPGPKFREDHFINLVKARLTPVQPIVGDHDMTKIFESGGNFYAVNGGVRTWLGKKDEKGAIIDNGKSARDAAIALGVAVDGGSAQAADLFKLPSLEEKLMIAVAEFDIDPARVKALGRA